MMRWLKRMLVATLLCVVSGAGAQVRINEICAVASDRLIRWDETGRARVGAGVNWYDSNFVKSGWSSGTGPVGMGAEVATPLQAQMLGTTPSVYMRKTFSASVAQATHPGSLTLEVEYTDGFVAYLNGTEIARKNAGAPGAPFLHDQVAFNGIAAGGNGFGNTNWIETLNLDAADSLLQAGDNVLSIQSHNNDIYLLDTNLYCKATLKSDTGQVLATYDGEWSWFVGIHEPSGGVVDYGAEPETDSDFLDWVELKNEGTQPVSLAGWSLTDDAGKSAQWIFPDVTLPVDGFLLVACSGKNIRDTTAPLLHTSFSLSRGGDYLGLYDASSNLVSEIAPEYPAQHPFFTYGWNEATMSFRYCLLPTPGKENEGVTFSMLPEPPEFSVDSGFYEGSTNVVISTPLAGASIYYTTDGSAPSAANGTLYSGSLIVHVNTALRAAVVSAEGIVSEPVTRTLLMNAPAALKSLPAVVLTASDGRSLFGPYGVTHKVGGDYTIDRNTWYPTTSDDYNIPLMHGRAYERRVCFEMFEAGTNLWTQVDAGLRFSASPFSRDRHNFNDLDGVWYGETGTNKPQFNVILRDIYGDTSVKNRFFENSSLKNIEQFRVRSGKNDWKTPFIKDEFVRRLYSEMGRVSSIGTLAGLWVNGEFRCYYNPVERYCEAFYQEHFGSDQKWDALSHESTVPERYDAYEGDDVAWLEMFDYVANNNMSIVSNYEELADRLDTKNFADYILINTYFSTQDWGKNNWHVSRERSASGRFRYHIWDAEMVMKWNQDFETSNAFTDRRSLGDNDDVQYIARLYQSLKDSDEFSIMMQDRISKHFFNGGVLEDAHMKAQFDELADELLPMLEYVRNTNDVDRTYADPWLAGRRPYYLQQLRDLGYWHDISSPLISPDGSNYVGQVEVRISHTNSSGTIYYTVDGSDPRAPGGAIHGTPYSAPIELSQSSQMKARVLKSGVWGPLKKAVFSRDNTDLLFTEVHYNPSDAAGEDTEFVEFQNAGTDSLSLDGFTIDGGIDFEFGPGTLAPGAYVVVARDLAAFAAYYDTSGMQIAGEYAGKLSNNGEAIQLEFHGKKLIEVAYNDARGWPVAANGGGPSLVPLNGAIVDQGFDILDYPGNWRASTYNGGSPGRIDPEPLPSIVINEIMAHTDTGDPIPYESNDQIELFNPTDSPLVFDANWYLSDDLDEPQKWNIPSGTRIPAGGWLVFDENDFHSDRVIGFGLNKAGELVMLSHRPGAGMDRVVDCVEFEGQANSFSWGRCPDGNAYFQTLEITPNAANQLRSELGVRIQALMYNPKPLDLYDADEVLEFIQLTNGASLAVNFIGESVTNTWRLNGGIDFSFADGTSMAAGETLWVVPFDPALEAEKKNIFCATYGRDAASVRLVGPWKGDLSNSGERVTLEKAQASDDLLLPEAISWMVVDEIIWLDEEPWPVEADGSGRPLLRTGSAGNDPASWVAPADFDADALPDDWELSLRPDLGDLGKGDFDGDGQSDWEEFIAGTVPLDADSFFSFNWSSVDGDYSLDWDSVPGRVYRVLWSSNLSLPFIELDEAAYPTNSYQIGFDESEDTVFFRLGVWTNAAPVDVDPVNEPPTAEFILPATDISLPVGTTVDVEINADDDVSVAYIDLYVNGVVVRSVTSSSLLWDIENLVAGTNLLTAIATDNEGAKSLIAERTVTVMGPEPEEPVVLLPVADAFVRGGTYGDTKYGTDDDLQVKTSSNEKFTRQSYLRFDLSSISGPVDGATLRLKVSTSGSDTHTAYFVSDDSWVETAITFNTKPDAGALLSSASTSAVGDWLELDMSDQINNELAGDGELSIVIIGNASIDVRYHSRETASEADRPQLIVDAP